MTRSFVPIYLNPYAPPEWRNVLKLRFCYGFRSTVIVYPMRNRGCDYSAQEVAAQAVKMAGTILNCEPQQLKLDAYWTTKTENEASGEKAYYAF